MEPHQNTGHPRRWAILGVLVISLLVVVLDNTILNVALRTLADPVHGLGASQGELEWAINSYTLVFAGLLFTFGVLGDRLGRRRFLLIGLALFGLASLLSAYAQDPAQLIAARALMGVGGAAIMPVTLSIISNVFDPRERARAIGVWAGAVGLAVAIGPVLGGALLEHYWWGSVFLINVPVVALGLVLVTALVPESRDPNPGRVDAPGVLLSVVGLVGLTYGIIDGGEHGFDRLRVWVAIVGGLAVLAWFIVHELRSDHPSLDVRLFRVPRFAAPVAMVGLVFFAAMGVMFFGAFYLQLVRGYSPLESGLLFLPFAVAQLIFAPRSAAMVRRYGGRAVSTVGLLLTAAALGAFVLIDADTPIWIFSALGFLQGAGMANIMPPATESIMSALPREKAGVGSAVSNTVRQVAGALGVAVLGSVLSAVYRDHVATSLADLPAPARAAAEESISGAYAAAAQLGPVAPRLIAAANDAFVSAMHWAAAVSALVAALGVVIVLRWMPGRPVPAPADARPAAEPELAGTA
ncbi:MFS transporter [Micromonospora narathiwatensis]|uniref:Drug resistance transporter, EmrB/QacA subfamily n=1 Tax=Micromonospora narathiwatensis TaxID=299146 RepID=A0A1A8Z7D2_9ACTN|nr:MFS transporter [Micromonospora narathiwatensis]SBT39775.1 drug resistance transporter, EmrB/QacA subfamily [Micromonospora narathiwatensis]